MPRDKTASHAKIVAAARVEFMEYGFAEASMRRIGERVGMTAAGLYRHFDSKEAMFEALVAPALAELQRWLEGYSARFLDALQSGGERWRESEADMLRELVYPRLEEYRLLLTRAQGSGHEDFLRELAADYQEAMLQVFPLLKERGYPVRELRPKELHTLLTAYLTALFQPVIRGEPLEEALRSLETVEVFFLPGWKALLGL